MKEGYVTVKEAAKIIGIGKAGILHRVKRGDFPGHKRIDWPRCRHGLLLLPHEEVLKSARDWPINRPTDSIPVGDQGWVSVAEAMRLLDQSRQSIHNHIKAGLFTEVKRIPRKNQPSHAAFYLKRDEVERCKETMAEIFGKRRHDLDVDPIVDSHDAAYMAGLIDGEGSVYMVQTTRTSFTIHVAVTNTHMGVIEWCRTTFGGSLGKVIRKGKQREHHAPGYQWACHCRYALACLRACVPYMKIKREQALLAIDFMDSMRERGYQHGHPVPAEEVERRQAIKAQMSKLNNPHGIKRAYRVSKKAVGESSPSSAHSDACMIEPPEAVI
jgi:hypothetical protein